MKKARMNISHSRFILSKLKIFGEIVTTIYLLYNRIGLASELNLSNHLEQHLNKLIGLI